MSLRYNYIGRTIRKIYRNITGKNKKIKLFEDIKPGDVVYMHDSEKILDLLVKSVETHNLTPLGVINLKLTTISSIGKVNIFVVDYDEIDQQTSLSGITTNYGIAVKSLMERMAVKIFNNNMWLRMKYEGNIGHWFIETWTRNHLTN